MDHMLVLAGGSPTRAWTVNTAFHGAPGASCAKWITAWFSLSA
ncbi:hypothetical protein [Embleya scabrispora]|nr:hypothetical protein [Embleya scabrispora]